MLNFTLNSIPLSEKFGTFNVTILVINSYQSTLAQENVEELARRFDCNNKKMIYCHIY